MSIPPCRARPALLTRSGRYSSQAVDKIGRTARRTVDTHVRHAVSRPRAATTLRRMTAMFNFTPDLRQCASPRVLSR